MRITQRTVGDVVILDCEGPCLIGYIWPDVPLSDVVSALVARGRLKVLVNLAAAEVTSRDEPLLGDLVRSFVHLRVRGGVLKLLSPPKGFRDRLVESRCGTIFEIYDDEEEAIRSFA